MWPAVLEALAAQLADGRIYDRDLQPLARALAPVLDAFDRRWANADPRFRGST